MREPADDIERSSATVTNEIRAGAAYVCQHSGVISLVDSEEIAAYAASLPAELPEGMVWDAEHHLLTEDPETLAAYVLCIGAINCGGPIASKVAEEGAPFDEGNYYFHCARALTDWFKTNGTPNSQQLQDLLPSFICKIFALPTNGNYANLLAKKFTLHLNELGVFLERGLDGQFHALIDRAEGSVDRAISQLLFMPNFRDVHNFQQHQIMFLKRAQSTIADLADSFGQIGMKAFQDTEKLTALPDNAVAAVLRVDGMIQCSNKLQDKINNQVALESGSEEELSLRAATILLVDQIAAAKGVRPIDIDRILWHRSHDTIYKGQSHLTVSGYY